MSCSYLIYIAAFYNSNKGSATNNDNTASFIPQDSPSNAEGHNIHSTRR